MMLLKSEKIHLRVFRNLQEKMKAEMEAKSPLSSGIRKYFLFEGDKLGVRREDGSTEVNPIKRAEGKTFVKDEDASPEALTKVIDDISTQLATEQSKTMIETIDKAVAQSGNTVDSKGMPPSPEIVLEMFEKMEMTFENGEPSKPIIVCHPSTVPHFEKAIYEMMNVEPHKTKYEEMVERKRKVFNEREASRKLVD